MRKAIAISLLLHCAFILHWLERDWPSFSASALPKTNIQATLAAIATSEEAKAPATRPVITNPSHRSPTKSTNYYVKKSTQQAVLPNSQALTAITDAFRTSQALHATEPPSALPVDGERQYRLSLARQARRFKSSLPNGLVPVEAGVVLLAIFVQAGSPLPRVELVQSSGYPVLDQQALVMTRHAVESAELPSTIRGRSFRMNLPVEFRTAN